MATLAASLAGCSATMLVVALIGRPSALARSLWVRTDVAPGRGLLAEIGAAVPARLRALGTRGLRRSLASAGREDDLDAVVGRKVVFAGVGAITVALGVPLPVSITLTVLGLRLPDLWVSRAAHRRRAAMDAEVPLLLDCLVAASSAGLAAPLALHRSAEALRGPLADELAATFAAVDLGRRWKEALAALGQRLDLPDLRRCIALLTRTEVLGVPLAASLADLASEVRVSRAAAAAERARTAPVKMLFPLVFLILPAFLLLTVVPVLLSTVRSIR